MWLPSSVVTRLKFLVDIDVHENFEDLRRALNRLDAISERGTINRVKPQTGKSKIELRTEKVIDWKNNKIEDQKWIKEILN